jgi:hypothetical protein
MQYEVYTNRKSTDDFGITDFISVGKKGSIYKRVVFSATELEHIYNLAFGDIDENGEIDDSQISDNGDRNKVLATIMDIIKKYTEKHPSRLIFFKGSSHERTRLYRMAIGLNLEELKDLFNIYMYVNESIIPFSKDQQAEAFLIKRKIV